MRIGTLQQRGEESPLYNVYYIVLPNSLKYTLSETFYGDTVSVPITFLPILSIIMMANMAIVFLVTKYTC